MTWVTEYRRRRLQGFTIREAAALASGRPCEREAVWNVPFWLQGRHFATVRVPGAHAYGAEQYARRYLAANIYPHETRKSGEPLPGGHPEAFLRGRADR